MTLDGVVPFGLLFEEPAKEPPVPACSPLYDEQSGVSYIEADRGQRVPYIEGNPVAMATETKAEREAPDVAATASSARTQTFTEAQRESTDADSTDDAAWSRNLCALSNLGTVTKTQGEGTD